jgi:pentatricopeptide repeat protein
VECNVITYNSLLSACGRAGRHADALSVFDAMRKEGVKPDKVTFACVIAAHAGLGEHRKALDAFRGMSSARVEPDAAAATAALAACAAGGFADEAAAIYRDFVAKQGKAHGDSSSRQERDGRKEGRGANEKNRRRRRRKRRRRLATRATPRTRTARRLPWWRRSCRRTRRLARGGTRWT